MNNNQRSALKRSNNKKKTPDGISADDMGMLSSLLLEAFNGSLRAQIESGEYDPRVIKQALQWLRDNNVGLLPNNGGTDHLASLLNVINSDVDNDYIETGVDGGLPSHLRR